MPSQRPSSQKSRNITEFFRPFARPKPKPVIEEVVHDNITVADRRTDSATPTPVGRQKAKVDGGTVDATHVAKKKDVDTTKSQQDVSHIQASNPFPSPSDIDTAAGARNEPSSALTSFTSAPPTPTAETRPLVRLPSLSPPSSPSMGSASPPLPSLPPPKTSADANTSFNSISTLSSLSTLPPSSQSSSKRTVKDGMLAVTNSDSESHDDDSDPLDDIDELIRRKRLKMSPAEHPETPVAPKDTASRGLRSFRRDRPPSTFRKPQSPPRKVYKFSLASLVKESAKEAALDEKVKKYELEHARDDHVNQRQDGSIKENGALGRLAARLEIDGVEEKEQLMQAMKRMDALQKDVQFRFYKENTSSSQAERAFPISSLAGTGWADLLKDPVSREATFKTGFAADIVRVQPLPDRVTDWILHELLHEAHPDLGYAYVSVLESSLSRCGRALVSARSEMLRKTLLKSAGREGSLQTVDDGRKKAPKIVAPAGPAGPPAGLRWYAMLLSRLSSKLSLDDKSAWLPLLMLSLLDESILASPITTAELQESIVCLLSPISDLDTITKQTGMSILSSISNPILIHRLLVRLPSTTASLHTFKRRLALCAFTKTRDYLSDSLTDASILANLTSYLRTSPKFKVRESTDFAVLGARFGILDIAISAGFSDFAFLPDPSSTAANDESGGGTAGVARKATNSEETSFNTALDALVSEIRNLMSQIKDPGAAHMRRTECKLVMERLTNRIDFAVRSKPKPKKGIFGSAGGGVKKLEEGFFRRMI